MNSVKNGSYRWMIYKEGDTWIGVALEFNIVVTGNDPKIAEIELEEAVIGYLESAKKLNDGFRPQQINSLLNQEADKEYEDKWNGAMDSEKTADDKSVVSPFSDVYKAGRASLPAVA
jgi:hypothetical protein